MLQIRPQDVAFRSCLLVIVASENSVSGAFYKCTDWFVDGDDDDWKKNKEGKARSVKRQQAVRASAECTLAHCKHLCIQ